MHSIEPFDLSLLPEHAQEELYNFYLLLKQRYAVNAPQQNPSYDIALEDLFKTTEKLKIQADPTIDIHDLIEQTHDTEI